METQSEKNRCRCRYNIQLMYSCIYSCGFNVKNSNFRHNKYGAC